MKRSVVGNMLAACVAVLALCAGPGDANAGRKGAPSPGMSNGIRVAGLWNLQVRNPDGSLATQRTFRNAFTGVSIFQQMFLGTRTFLDFSLVLAGPTGSDPCTDAGGAAFQCMVREPAQSAAAAPYASYNLVRSEVPLGIKLQGSVVVTRAASITAVQGLVGLCPPSSTPAECRAGGQVNQQLSLHTLSAPEAVPVVPGQQVLVSVEYQFSAL